MGIRRDRSRRRAVLVDPDPRLLQLAVQAHPDLDVVTVRAHADLAAALATDDIGLVVVDLEDPLLAYVLTASVPVVVTARAGVRTGEGFDGVLHRPFAARDVQRTVRRVLGLRARPVLDPARWLGRLGRALPWLRLSAAGLGAVAVVGQRPALAAAVVAAALVMVYVRRTTGLVRPWLAVTADVLTAALVIAVTGGPVSPFVGYGLVVAVAAGSTLGPGYAGLAGLLLSVLSVAGWVPAATPTVRPAALAVFALVLPTLAVAVAVARQLWPTPDAGPLRVLAQADRSLRRLERAAAQLPAILTTAGAARSALDAVGALPGVVGALLCLEDAGRLYETAARGLLDHPRVVLDASLAATARGEVPASVRAAGEEYAVWFAVPLRVDGRRTGMLYVACGARPRRRTRLGVVAVAAEAALALENARAFERLRAVALDQDRVQLARRLSEGAGESLAHVQLELSVAAGDPEGQRLTGLAASLRRAQDELGSAIIQLRDGTDAPCLAEAVRAHCRDVAHLTRVDIRVDAGPVPRLPAARERALFTIVRDLLERSVALAGADGLDVVVGCSRGCLLVAIDNPSAVTGRLSHPSAGLGRVWLDERVAAVGAQLAAVPRAQGGSRIVLTCPVDATAVVS